MKQINNPEIYVRNYCGYCYKVIRAIKNLQYDVEIKNIWADPDSRDKLQNATGSNRVPVLRYQDEDGNEVWMPESDDIINLLSQFDNRVM